MKEHEIENGRKELLGQVNLIMLAQAVCGMNTEMYFIWGRKIKKSRQEGVISAGNPIQRTR